jgi:hypothetical protein
MKQRGFDCLTKYRSKTPPICLILLLFLIGYVCADQNNPFLADYESANTTYISQVLNRLTDTAKYDKRLRPRYGEGSVNVGITIHVISISAVSEVEMDFTIDFYLRQSWEDPRLAFGKLDLGFAKIKELTVGVDYLEKLWKPVSSTIPKIRSLLGHVLSKRKKIIFPHCHDSQLVFTN